MKFRLGTVLWGFALLASALTAFGAWGILATGLAVSFWAVVFRRTKMSLPRWFVSALFVSLVAIILQPVVSRISPIKERRYSCQNNLKEIALAVLEYQEVNGSLPQDIVDQDGRPLLSWRIELLPYLDQQALYEAIKRDEPWDSPSNRQLWSSMPEQFRCPSCEFACEEGTVACSKFATNYYAVVGPETIWEKSTQQDWEELTYREIRSTDGKFQGFEPPKIMLVDTIIPDACWMQPIDLSVEDALEVIFTNRRHGHLGTIDRFFSASSVSLYTHVAAADAQVESIYNDAAREEILSRLVFDESVEVDWQKVLGSNPWGAGTEQFTYKWEKIYVVVLFVLLSLLPVVKLRQLGVNTVEG